jgi:nickel-dependent lactate racemase
MAIDKKKGRFMHTYTVSFANEKIEFSLPEHWKLLSHAVPREIPAEKDLGRLFNMSLANPVDAKPLRDALKQAKSAAIVIDDATRPTPVSRILPLITDFCISNGIEKSQISIVIAVGTHHPMADDTIRERVGTRVHQDFDIFNHNSLADDLVEVGKLANGEILKINRIVSEADVKIGLGSVIPHPANGFGGGPKLIFPGISSYDAVHRHHISNFIKPGSYVGNLKTNEFYAGIREATAMIDFDYLFNCVLNYREEVVDLVSGAPIPAFEKAVDATIANCGFAIDAKADITILSCFPYDVIPQIFKPLRAASLVTNEGGLIMLVAKNLGPLPEGLMSILQFAAGQDGNKLMRNMLEGKLTSYGAPLNLNFYVPILRALRAFRCVVVTTEIPVETIEEMGLTHFEDVQEAIDYYGQTKPGATVHIFSAGGMTIPIFKDEFNPNTLFKNFTDTVSE